MESLTLQVDGPITGRAHKWGRGRGAYKWDFMVEHEISQEEQIKVCADFFHATISELENINFIRLMFLSFIPFLPSLPSHRQHQTVSV